MKKIVIAMSMVSLIAAGCAKEPELPEPATIKVLAWNANLFNERYGSFYIATHPDDDLEVISVVERLEQAGGGNPDTVVDELIEKENPDVIALPHNFFERARDKGALQPLDDLAKKDKFDLAEIAPAVTDALSAEGKLYGIAATFTGYALYYNKALFDRYKIAYPTDYMSWNEVFTLANRFAKAPAGNEPAEFGLDYPSTANPFMMALNIGETDGISVYANGKFTLNTEAWERIFQNVKSCLSSGACLDRAKTNKTAALNLKESQLNAMPFLTGRVAMAISDSRLFRTLGGGGYESLEWGMATVPVSEREPDTGAAAVPEDVFSIAQNAPQPAAAWRLLQYIGGEDYAKVLPRIDPSSLAARSSAEDQSDDDKAVFYKLQRRNLSPVASLGVLPMPVINRIEEISQTYTPQAMSGDMTVSDALKRMESEMQSALDRENENSGIASSQTQSSE
ncbi:ABC transporter substrate-binding protein [Cohnella hashimotonis]|uniref:ABC transporter substrate-binding protein n=1 Tax=Cohnella hashimotonis TaxID=2826895 RepID=A0ABT6TR22_9BACL|nr:ABC transporter substrate-binding protein [Cohnella hashimotonis]MDI4648384.1 ABC transporter substrate-binding protein [Cohnella hashimotonis]